MISLLVMAMMVMIVVVLASFIKVESTLASAKQAETIARFNALAAVRLAGAALQERLGPDTRVSAYSSIYEDPASSSDPFDYPVLGAWRSWEGLNHDIRTNGSGVLSRYAGRPEKPDYSLKLKTFDLASANGQRNRFLGWMLSNQMGYGDLSFVPPSGTSTKPAPPPSVVASANTVPLVGRATDVRPVRQINVEPISFIDGRPAATTTDGSQGYFSWWVGGENQKVRVVNSTVSQPAAGANALLMSERTKTFGSPDLDAISYPVKSAELYHDVSLYSEGLLTNTATGGLRKDFSLFTETWDWAAFLDSQRLERMPLFRLRPAKIPPASNADPAHDLLFQRPLPDNLFPSSGIGNRKRNALPYWWADYGSLGGSSAGVVSGEGGTVFGGYTNGRLSSFPPVRSWAYLADYSLHYRKYVTIPNPMLSSTVAMLPPQPVGEMGNLYSYYERVHRHPIIARIQYVFVAMAKVADANPAAPTYTPGFLVQPVVTMWNPYNVSLSVPGFRVFCKTTTLPIYIKPDYSGPNSFRHPEDHLGSSFLGSNLNIWISDQPDLPMQRGQGTISLAPGETRVYSMRSLSPSNTSSIRLSPGYSLTGAAGIEFQFPGAARPKGTSMKYVMSKDIDLAFLAPPPFQTSVIRRDGIYYDAYPDNYFKANWPPEEDGYSPVRFSFVDSTNAEFRGLYGLDPRDVDIKTDLIEDLSGIDGPRAFATFSFGLRLSNDGFLVRDSRTGVKTASKGLLQASPFTTYTELGWKSSEVLTGFMYANSDVFSRSQTGMIGQQGRPTGGGGAWANPSTNHGIQYSGALNPINAPYDLYFQDLRDFADSDAPQVGLSNRGYILTGSGLLDGLSLAVFAELPVKPLQSLASLQNCDIRATNPAPPFHFGIIGNSDASPILPPDDVVGRWIDVGRTLRSRDEIPVSFLQYDDSYCLNHVLFDDWFVSSLAPLPADWASLRPSAGNMFSWNSAVMTSMQKNWSSFAAGTTQLPNACYQPASSAAQFDLAVRAGSTWQPSLQQPVAYQRVAASLRVPGQFNVNSTSVAAWRAMLGNLRSTTVPFIKPGNTAVSVVGASNPLSRMSISHEEPVTSEKSRAVLGFASLTNDQLDRLAVEMVRQVKLRGPFLSLSEFVNRQLALPTGSLVSANDDPSLNGAIGAALKALEISGGSMNPALHAQNLGQKTSNLGDFTARLTVANRVPLGDWTSPSGNYPHPKAAEGSSTFGLPGWPRQADVLERLAPVITVRDDTFIVRAMGTSPLFNGASGSVWCEAVYQRLPEYVDASVPAHEAPAGDRLDAARMPSLRANVVLGRRMRLVSFRWLNSKEL